MCWSSNTCIKMSLGNLIKNKEYLPLITQRLHLIQSLFTKFHSFVLITHCSQMPSPFQKNTSFYDVSLLEIAKRLYKIAKYKKEMDDKKFPKEHYQRVKAGKQDEWKQFHLMTSAFRYEDVPEGFKNKVEKDPSKKKKQKTIKYPESVQRSAIIELVNKWLDEFWSNVPELETMTLPVQKDIPILEVLACILKTSLAKENHKNMKLFLMKCLPTRISSIVSGKLSTLSIFDEQVIFRTKSRITKIFRAFIKDLFESDIESKSNEEEDHDEIQDTKEDDKIEMEDDDVQDPIVEESETHVKIPPKSLDEMIDEIFKSPMRWSVPDEKTENGIEIIQRFATYQPSASIIRCIKSILLCPIESNCPSYFGLFSPAIKKFDKQFFVSNSTRLLKFYSQFVVFLFNLSNCKICKSIFLSRP
jgi:hypothetical protein